MKSAQPRDPLDADRLRRALVGSGGAYRRVDVVEETGSTNADLLARAAAGEDIDGAVLLAEYQSAGRGRHGRSWSAPTRSQVALSVGVGVGAVPSEAWGWLPLLTGVAVVDAVREVTGVTAGLKWPNDVLVGTGKLAGILAEVAAPEPVVVVGLGLNVTMTAEEAPDPVATSLSMLDSTADRTFWPKRCFGHLARRIGSWRAAAGRRRDTGRRLPRRTASRSVAGCEPACPGTARWRASPPTSTNWADCASIPAPSC